MMAENGITPSQIHLLWSHLVCLAFNRHRCLIVIICFDMNIGHENSLTTFVVFVRYRSVTYRRRTRRS